MRIGDDGNVGIGVDDPERSLDVEGDIQLTGDIVFKGYQDLQDSNKRILYINKYGKTEPLSLKSLRSYMYQIDCYLTDDDDPVEMRGAVGLSLPSWANRIADDKQILYTGIGCPTWVGIGTDLPEATLDVVGTGRFHSGIKVGGEASIHAGLYIENKSTASNPYFDKLILIKDVNGREILQLEESGLLRAREIKIDESNWADYVFQMNYPLMPLNEVKSFIEKNGHLPNVPSAAEIKEEGLNLGDAAKFSMEKIEELTLYVIDLDEKLTNQEAVIGLQQKLLDEQQKLLNEQKETIRLQQNLILELKQLTNKK